MQSIFVGILTFIFICSPAIIAQAAAPIVLDPLLDGILPTCHGSKAFDRFRRSVASRHGYDASGKRINPNAVIAISAPLAPAMGSITATNKGLYTQVIVPLNGNFRSLPMHAIEFAFGNENGINITTIQFSTSKSDVYKIFGRDIRAASRIINQRVQAGETGADQSITFDENGGRARIICDISN